MSLGKDRGENDSVWWDDKKTNQQKKKSNLQIEAGPLPTVIHLSVLERGAVQRVQIRQQGREAVDANGDNDGSDELLMPWVAYVTVFPIRQRFLIWCRLS